MTITDTVAKAVWEFKPLNGAADNPLDALVRAQKILLEEGRWVKSKWYEQHNPDLDPDDPFCDGWEACAAGAVLLVTVGAARQCSKLHWTKVKDEEVNTDGVLGSDYVPPKYEYVPQDIPREYQKWSIVFPEANGGDPNIPVPEDVPGWDVYNEALDFLNDGIRQQSGRSFSDVPTFNDNGFTTREDVIEAFTYGIVKAAQAETRNNVVTTVKSRLGDLLTAGIS